MYPTLNITRLLGRVYHFSFLICYPCSFIASDILHAKIKQKELVNKSDISNLLKSYDLDTKLATLAAKVELNPEEGKIVKLKIFDSSYFCNKIFFGDDDLQNMFVYQSTFNMLDLKID